MIHKSASAISSARFNPYEDFLGLGTATGLETISIPGAGLANYDSLVANPFATNRQRQEQEVHSLLEKLRPDMITLNPHVPGTVDKASSEVIEREYKEEEKVREAEALRLKKKAGK
jgi:U3 small nucleolar RNA-associated protein 7